MPPPSFELRELFHLTLLRHLGARLSGRSYAVKGGICLRFFHRSPRLSEDMDLDVVSRVRLQTLENAVDSVLAGKALIASLLPAGIASLETSKPKQTATTQRWKIALRLADGTSLPTKLECSRRQDRLEYAAGVPDGALLTAHKMVPFAAQFYGAPAMAAQKIEALASPARNALRDLFDLHHLLFSVGVEPARAAAGVGAETIEAAADKIAGFKFTDFRSQVLPYLSSSLTGLYREPAAFEKQKTDVEQVLVELLR
ncbi:MAG: nucleotidyl transferase AbiEii/AbiGii toxin family protein [Elusimicrobia bacterium]|nr:nucleotidyl transferase AbiEii/AbiGii toxin family protein [Elusimicrobiota bacterium]